ncbi:MAG: 50S ribosomal protein L5 [Verrucomicrobiota bacterium]|jgi:large subunit ribosomal protein L5|nr:50S ribosomal protein L5 [Verrucomicrobiota bacterium]MDP7048919.1 50S ribosomal protein L5 [Verrucomicrobiota bacterium]
MIPRLQEKYQQEIRTKLRGLDKYKNVHQVPTIEKIVINMGVSPELGKEVMGDAMRDLTIITGRKPTLNKAKVSVANFKLRKGMTTGCRVTLRRQGMYEFLDRLVATALPRIRDFRGVKSTGFDGHGNYSVGVDDQSIFPEIDVDKVKHTQGMDITIVTTAQNDDDAYELLKEFGMPFDGKRK